MTDTIPEAVIEAMGRAYDLAPGPRHQTIPAWHKAIGRAALKAAEQAGWKLVPVEPTEAMLAAALQPVREPLRLRASDGAWLADHSVGYRAMIAASPEVG